jgi:uncharacterized membrane protein YeaQ/YmgE (transglycosylase-associated protein family)
MEYILWTVLGALAGFVVERVARAPVGLLMNLVTGLLGAFAGGLVMNVFHAPGATGLDAWGLAAALAGAVALLLAVHALRRNAPRP